MTAYRKFSFSGAILPEHLEFYSQQGFIHFVQFFSSETINFIDNAVNEVYDGLLRASPAKIYGIPIRYGFDTQGDPIVQRLPLTTVFSSKLYRLLSDSPMSLMTGFVNRLDARIGFEEKDGLVTNYFVNAPNSTYKQMGWHTDVLRDFFMLKRVLPMINVGIYLTDSNAQNGGLRIIPGTHRQGLMGMLCEKIQFFDKRQDARELLIEAARGDLVLHDGRLWHRVGKAKFADHTSIRKVMYVPIICGKKELRHLHTKTPMYHKVNRFMDYR